MHFTTESFDLADRQLKSYTLELRGVSFTTIFKARLLFRPHNPKEKWKQKYNATDVHDIGDRYTRFIAISGSSRIIS